MSDVRHPMLDKIVLTIPEQVTIVAASTEAAFAQYRRGGTGRFDLVIWEPTETGIRQVTLVHQLSKGQARLAADLINRAFVAWLPHTGALLVVPKEDD